MPASAATSLTDAVGRLAASERLQRTALSRLMQPETRRELDLHTAALEAELARLPADQAAPADLAGLLGLDHRARAIDRSAGSVVDELTAKLRHVEHDLSALESELRGWKDRGKLMADERVPAEVAAQARAVEAALGSDVGSDTLTGVNDADYKPPFALTAKLNKLKARLDRPQLSAADIARLQAAMKARD